MTAENRQCHLSILSCAVAVSAWMKIMCPDRRPLGMFSPHHSLFHSFWLPSFMRSDQPPRPHDFQPALHQQGLLALTYRDPPIHVQLWADPHHHCPPQPVRGLYVPCMFLSWWWLPTVILTADIHWVPSACGNNRFAADNKPQYSFYEISYCRESSMKVEQGAAHLSLSKQHTGTQLLSLYITSNKHSTVSRARASQPALKLIKRRWQTSMFGKDGITSVDTRVGVDDCGGFFFPFFFCLWVWTETRSQASSFPPCRMDREAAHSVCAAGAHIFAQCCMSNRLLTLERICFPSVGKGAVMQAWAAVMSWRRPENSQRHGDASYSKTKQKQRVSGCRRMTKSVHRFHLLWWTPGFHNNTAQGCVVIITHHYIIQVSVFLHNLLHIWM